ncbi:MAG: bifunctional riboflavin kinase/FAD synthetase [Aquabacterium sp.]
MRVFRGLAHPRWQRPCALTIGNFDGVHRGHQAMLALLTNEARHRGIVPAVMTFEPHPRDWFAQQAAAAGRSGAAAPLRIATLRDKLAELSRCGIEQVVVLRFDAALAALSPQAFIDDVLVGGLGVRYVLVGDDFRFGARRAGDYALLDAAGAAGGFDVARMMSYEVHGLRVSSSVVRQALVDGDMARAAALLGRPYAVSGHVVHGRKLGRELGFPTLNLRVPQGRPAAGGIFVARLHGLTAGPLPAVASLGVRPSVEDAGRVLLEVHALQWPLPPQAGYGRIVRVDLLHRLHEERRYDSLPALRDGIAADRDAALAWFAAELAR